MKNSPLVQHVSHKTSSAVDARMNESSNIFFANSTNNQHIPTTLSHAAPSPQVTRTHRTPSTLVGVVNVHDRSDSPMPMPTEELPGTYSLAIHPLTHTNSQITHKVHQGSFKVPLMMNSVRFPSKCSLLGVSYPKIRDEVTQVDL